MLSTWSKKLYAVGLPQKNPTPHMAGINPAQADAIQAETRVGPYETSALHMLDTCQTYENHSSWHLLWGLAWTW